MGQGEGAGSCSVPEQSLLQQFLQPLHTPHPPHLLFLHWEGVLERENSSRASWNQILAPHHSAGLFLSQVRSPAQLDFVAAREGEVEPAPEVSAPGRSFLRSEAEGLEQNPNILSPVLGFTRAGTCYPAQFGTKPHASFSNWETTFPEGMRSSNFCSTASMQAQDLEGVSKICHFITALGTKTKTKGKQNRAPPGIHKEETKNMINRLDYYFLRMTYCSSCYISRFLLS